MIITDAQIHIWGTGLPSNAAHWPVTSFSAAEAIALMDAAGVDAAVIHPPSWDPGATELAIAAVEGYPGQFAIMGGLPLDDPDTEAQVATLREQPGMLGLRYLFLDEHARQLEDGTLDWFWAATQQAGVPVALLATDSLAEIGAIAQRYPELRITIDHLGGRGGNTDLKDHAALAHMPELLALARHSNIAVKVTGAPGYSAQDYPFPIVLDYVHRIFDAFGPERTFWGTDISKMPCSWRACVTMFTEEMPWLRGDDLELVMGKAVRDWWGWP